MDLSKYTMLLLLDYWKGATFRGAHELEYGGQHQNVWLAESNRSRTVCQILETQNVLSVPKVPYGYLIRSQPIWV